MIWIRADANREIGTGHIMRCMSIADALKRRGQRVCFITADESGAPVLENRGQEYRILHSDYRNMEEELPGLEGLLAEKKPDFFLADSYFVTKRYLQEIRRRVPVGILDDKALTGMPADLLINYNIFADGSLYRGGAADRYLLGADYVPLRREFEGIKYLVREKAETVLITTGGSDRYNLAGQLLKKALESPGAGALSYIVVSGVYNAHLPALREMESAHENVRVCCNVSDMSGLMSESDIAVSAGGSTMYELSAMGVPIICFSFVDNQERIVRGFVREGLVSFGGDYLAQGELMLDEVIYHINKLAADFELRRGFSKRLRRLVDGRGAERIAETLCDMTRGH